MYLVALYMCTKYVTFNEAGSLLKIIDLFAEHLDLDLEWQVQWSRVLPVLSIYCFMTLKVLSSDE